jgi:hypothetical protein
MPLGHDLPLDFLRGRDMGAIRQPFRPRPSSYSGAAFFFQIRHPHHVIANARC